MKILILIFLTKLFLFFPVDSFENYKDFGNAPLVIDGHPVPISRYPYMGYMEYKIGENSSSICSASIYSPYILLTAAHCLTDEEGVLRQGLTILVVLGRTNVELTNKTDVYIAHEYKIHEQYDSESFQHDIALLKLDKPIVFNENMKPVSIRKYVPDIDVGTVSGWGLVAYDEGTTFLKAAKMKLLSRKSCRKLIQEHRREKYLMKGHFCGVSPLKGNETWGRAYRGDSGGPVVIRRGPERSIQIGVVSHGPHGPDFGPEPILSYYTEVAYYYDWIINEAEKLMKKNNTEDSEHPVPQPQCLLT